MYDWPETANSMNNLWSLIADNLRSDGINTPHKLSRPEHPSKLWTKPELLIGQTCGWPYANILRGKVIPFARFDYDLADCSNGYYNSVYIGRTETDTQYLAGKSALLRSEKIAINSDDSQSGFQVFREITGEYSRSAIPDDIRVISGAHRNSVKMVAASKANIAAIDAVAFELAKQHEKKAASKVKIIGRSMPLPGLPLITSLKNEKIVPYLYEAISSAISSLSSEDKSALKIRNIVSAHDDEYDVFL